MTIEEEVTLAARRLIGLTRMLEAEQGQISRRMGLTVEVALDDGAVEQWEITVGRQPESR